MSAKAGLTGYRLLLGKGTSRIRAAFSFYSLAREGKRVSTFASHLPATLKYPLKYTGVIQPT